jgi:hypothetical protein
MGVGRKFFFIAAKSLKLIRITNAEGQYLSAPIAQMLLLHATKVVS